MLIIGHRGARGLAPENTVASLKKGLAHHADMLEFDLHVTSDGVAILHHDPYLTDPDGQRLVIKEHTYGDLLRHKQDLATFIEVLERVGHAVPLYVEVKPEVDTVPIIKIIKSYLSEGWQPEYFRLASFDQQVLRQLHEALPDIPTVVLERWSGMRAARRARELGTETVCMNERWLWWGFIRSVKRSGWQLYAYTLNDPAKARRWAKYGLAGVVTDYPDLFEKR